METIKLLEESRWDQWDQFVTDHPHSIAWHLSGWSRLVERHYGTRFLPLAVFRNGGIAGVLPLYEVKTFRGGSRLISVPYAVAGGVLGYDRSDQSALIEEAIKRMAETGARGLTLKQYKHQVDGSFTVDENYFNRELDLSVDKTEILKQFAEPNRKALEMTEGSGYVLEYPSEDVDGFFKMLSRFSSRKGIPGVSKRWIQDLMDLEMYRIAILRSGNDPICATMVKTFRKTVSFPFTCIRQNDDGRHLPIYSLYWQLILHFKSEGFEIFHSGRIPATEEVDAYRLGWGGVRHPYYYQYYPATTTSTEYSSKRGWKREAFTALWKYLPVSLSNAISPFITRQFP